MLDSDPPKYNSNVIFDNILRESSKDNSKILHGPFMRLKAHQDIEKLYQSNNLKFNRRRFEAVKTPEN